MIFLLWTIFLPSAFISRDVYTKLQKQVNVKVWVFFKDKGIPSESLSIYLENVKNSLDTLAIKRRRNALGTDIVDTTDLPVNPKYIQKLKDIGMLIHYPSKWLNAVSGWVSDTVLDSIQKLPFVSSVYTVKKGKIIIPRGKPVKGIKGRMNYGLDSTQIRSMDIDSLQTLGYYGSGVRIGIFDTGFEKGHECLKHINVYKERDFLFPDTISIQNNLLIVNKDTTVMDTFAVLDYDSVLVRNDTAIINGDIYPMTNGRLSVIVPDPYTGYDPKEDWRDPDWQNGIPLQTCQTDHGTAMLSLIGGYKEGELTGVAFGAEFVLAKTEIVRNDSGYVEREYEEDNWIRACEWAESLGVDIVSSSVGYRLWDDGTGYNYSDMDGNTPLITRVADEAARKGVFVFNAIGNISYENPTLRPDTCIVAPADGDSVLTIGGFDPYDSSSACVESDSGFYGAAIGPTFDGRIKPDLVGPYDVYVANGIYSPEIETLVTNVYPYVWGSGTSGATAMVAGIAALLLEGHPDWRGRWGKLVSALKSTASKSASPNDTFGYGIPDAVKAMFYEMPSVEHKNYITLNPLYPNPYNPNNYSVLHIPYTIDKGTYVAIYIYSPSGKLMWKKEIGYQVPGQYVEDCDANFSSGIYTCILYTGYKKDKKHFVVIK